jgi:lysophospholipase L1-like esterase
MSGFGILGTTKPSVDDIADALEAGVGTADLARVQSAAAADGAVVGALSKLSRWKLREARVVTATPPVITTSATSFSGFALGFPAVVTSNDNWNGVANFWGGFMARATNRIKPRVATATPATAVDPLLTTGFDDGGSGVSFYTNADVFTVFVNTSNTNPFRFFVDSLDGAGPLAVSLTGTVAAQTADSHIKLDFTGAGGARDRLIHVEGPQAWAFSRVFLATGSTYKVWAPAKDDSVRIAILHDSYGFGPVTGQYTTPVPITQDSYVLEIARLLDFRANIYNSSIGGSGLGVAGGGGKPSFDARVYDALNLLPDGTTKRSSWSPELIIVPGSINNLSTADATITAALDSIHTYVRTRNGSVPMVFSGPVIRPSDYVSRTAVAKNALIKAWVAAKRTAGDRRIAFVDVSTSTDAWIDGDGFEGAATGIGISDIAIGIDGAHPSYRGHGMFARRLLAGCCAALAAM